MRKGFEPFPQLRTQRLRLAMLCRDDVEGVFALRSNPEVIRYSEIVQYTDMEQAQAYIGRVANGYAEERALVWSVRLADTGEFIGSICLWNYSADGTAAEIGYDMLPVFHRNGYMTEAARAVLRFGFDHMGLQIIFADLHEANERSVKLLLRLGFRLEKTYDEPAPVGPVRMAVYSLGRDQALSWGEA